MFFSRYILCWAGNSYQQRDCLLVWALTWRLVALIIPTSYVSESFPAFKYSSCKMGRRSYQSDSNESNALWASTLFVIQLNRIEIAVTSSASESLSCVILQSSNVPFQLIWSTMGNSIAHGDNIFIFYLVCVRGATLTARGTLDHTIYDNIASEDGRSSNPEHILLAQKHELICRQE